MPGHHHRSGPLKQTNKRNKRSKASKRSLSRSAGGRVAGNANGTSIAAQSKADRRNTQQQKRDQKRQELLRKKRGLDGLPPPPRMVGIISLGEHQEIEEDVRDALLVGADKVSRPHCSEQATVSCKFDVHKKNGQLTLLTSSSAFSSTHSSTDEGAVLAALDLARVCDILLLVVDGNGSKIDRIMTEIQLDGIGDDNMSTTGKIGPDFDHLVSERGDRILTAIKGQGLPTPVTVLAHTEKGALDGEEDDDDVTMKSVKSVRRASKKRHLALKQYVSRFALTEFGSANDRVVELNLFDDSLEGRKVASASLVRTLCSMACSPPKWVATSPRSFIVSDSVELDHGSQEIRLTGFARGLVPLDCNSIFHVPNVGALRCKAITRAVQPLHRHEKHDVDSMDTDDLNVVIPDPVHKESLDMFAYPDALEGEQNLIGFDEDSDLEAEDNEEIGVARPTGWSDYQAAWLDAVDQGTFEDGTDHGQLAEELNRKTQRSDVTLGGDYVMDLDEANHVTAAEKESLLHQRRKEENEHMEFPDEVEVGEDRKASERFARYRSLKSFRKSLWDPKESLPKTYASIYHFASFKATQRSVRTDMKEVMREAERAQGQCWGQRGSRPEKKKEESGDDDDLLKGCVPKGSYVTITLAGVPADRIQALSPKSLMAAVSLLPHESKVSVLHLGLSQTSSCDSTTDVSVKSKDLLTFRCGWRTWQARPVFSQNNLNCDKHKFERFMPVGGAFFAASIFGPVTYTPCPVLVFRESQEGAQQLVAIGSMLGADADRIILKRIILTGYPVRVHKRHATVKYMFYNPDDVKWFQPAHLYTKHGLQGNIVESVGDHGTMKCLFHAPIKQHDTVCLPLYKRVYPKYPIKEDPTSLQVR